MTTQTAVQRFSSGLPFRGLLKNVAGMTNGALLDVADLGWKVVSMPVDVRGRRESRQAAGYQALVRSDTGALLSITSDSFVPHQNGDLLAGMQSIADAGNAEIVLAGAIDGGRKVVAVARLKGSFTLPFVGRAVNNHAGVTDDTTELFVVISGGHEVGTPYKLRGLAFRLWCVNGAFFTRGAEATYTATHRTGIAGDGTRQRIEGVYTKITHEFMDYGKTAECLLRTAATAQQRRLYVGEVVQPGFHLEVGKALGIGMIDLNQSPVGVWEAVNRNGQRAEAAIDRAIIESKSYGMARLGAALVQEIYTQVGANGDTLWTAYNGITHYVDHTRGRTDETGVDAALFGAGAVLKERALVVASAFAGVA